jgi:hypothetical protein
VGVALLIAYLLVGFAALFAVKTNDDRQMEKNRLEQERSEQELRERDHRGTSGPARYPVEP